MLAAAVVCVFAGCANRGDAAKKGEAQTQGPPVEVGYASLEQVPLQVRAIGNIEAFSRVDVKSQVSGQLVRVYFEEGQDVGRGDLLFRIDPRMFEQAVLQAEANVARDIAALRQAEAAAEKAAAEARNARSQSERYSGLAAKGIISREANEQYRTNAEAAERTADASQAAIGSARAAAKASEAQLADARLQLSYTEIHAPITGRTGSLTVKQGNLVSANAEPALVVINQMSPTYAAFSVPEQTLDQIRRFSQERKLVVEALPNQSQGPPARGTLDFIDNAVDPATGTIRLKAVFENKDRRLWPGQFVNVVMTLTTEQAVVVPTAAVQRGQSGDYVFIVEDDLTASQRVVEPSRIYDGKTILKKGVEPGERVVTDGQIRVRSGQKVSIKRDSGEQESSQKGEGQ